MKGSGRPYTPAEDAAIRAAMGPLLRQSRAIARQLAAELPGRNEDSILNRARYLRIQQDYQKPVARPRAEPPQVWKRRCLGCPETFKATSPFIRMCEACKRSGAWRAGA